MKTSERGVCLIARYEGCKTEAYHIPGEQYYTIGYGHYGPDVKPGQVITKAQAEAMLKADLARYEGYVNGAGLTFVPNQNQFDALVSFTYNCGPGNLKKLTKDRSPRAIADKLPAYCNGANPNVKKGLLRRRQEERELFLTPDAGGGQSQPAGQPFAPSVKPEEKASEVSKPESGARTVVKETARVTAEHGLKCRSKPDVSAPALCIFEKGTRLQVLEHTNAGWVKITTENYKGKAYTGYCSAKYLVTGT